MDETTVSRQPFDRVKEIVDRSTGEVISRERLDGNKNFVMFFRDKIEAFSALVRESPTSANVLLTLIANMDGTNSIAISQRSLASLAGISAATVNRCIDILVDYKFMEVYKVGSASVYSVNSTLVWTTFSDGRKYARCKADIVLSRDEQPPIEKKRIKVVTVKAKKQQTGQQLIPGTENH